VNFAWSVPFALAASLVAAASASPRLSREGIVLAVASGALASAGGYALWYAALRGLTATRAALVQLSVPPLAALGGVLLLGEHVTLRLALSATAILVGIALAVTSRKA
jgi:drug/metabolite transporter (DMT)-like permease